MARAMRILSIDGGGIRGVIPASVLAEIEAMIQAERGPDAHLADHFDLVAGTSTGGIIALLMLDPGPDGRDRANPDRRPVRSARDIVDFYLDNSATLFARSWWDRIRRAGAVFASKYGNEGFHTVLDATVGPPSQTGGDLMLSHLLKPTVIPTYVASEADPYFFKQHLAAAGGRDFAARDVALATAAAPTFFEPVDVRSTTGDLGTCVDGGLFANNPTLCAYSEARRTFGHAADDMAILSIGTGSLPETFTSDQLRRWGVLTWARPLIDMMFVGSDRTIDHYITQIFSALGPGTAAEQYLRLQADLTHEDPETALMDNHTPANLRRLVEIGHEIVDRDRDRIERFLHTQLLPAPETSP
jgi:patatin-like phospholipase/acyl hydrolase